MPHEWNNILVVTKDELIPEFFPSWEALRKKLARDEKKAFGLRRARQGKGRGNEVLIAFDSLPEEWQRQLGDPRRKDCSMERFFWEDAEAVAFFSSVRPGKYGNLDIKRQREYVLDASVLRAALRWRSAHYEECIKSNQSFKNTYKVLAVALDNFQAVRKSYNLSPFNLPSNPFSLKRKMERFEAEGYGSLLKGYNNNNRGKSYEQTYDLLESMYAHQEFKPTRAEVSRQLAGFISGYVEVINRETGEVYDPKEFRQVSDRAITQFLGSWGSSSATSRKRTGNRQLRLAAFVPFEKLKHPDYAGEVISVDDRQPPFEYADGKRMWFYLGVDLGSEAITVWVHGTDKKGIILEFYRQMVRNYAEWGLPLPAEIECESNLNADYRDTFLREGAVFNRVRIEANNARAKRCEAYWKQMRYGLEKKHADWIARPFARSESNQASAQKTKLVPYDKLVEQGLRDIETWNNMPCTISKENESRWKYFISHQHPANRRPIPYRALLPSLGFVTKSTVSMAGQVRFRKSVFLLADEGEIATGEKLIGFMQVLAGKSVDIYWLDGNDGECLAAVCCLSGMGRVVCELVEQPVTSRSKIGETEEQARNRELFARYRGTLEGYSRRRYHEIEKVAVLDHRTPATADDFRMPGLTRYEPEEVEDVEILNDDGPEKEPVVVDFKPGSNSNRRSFATPLKNRI